MVRECVALIVYEKELARGGISECSDAKTRSSLRLQRSSTVLHSEPPGQLLEHSSNVIILIMATDVAFDTSMVSIVPQTPPAIC
jgi:hypothetical protein